MNNMIRNFALAIVIPACLQLPAIGQTRIDLQSQANGRGVDFSQSDTTKPVKTGVALPSTCSAGEMFLRLGAPAGQSLYVCSPADTWSIQGGGVQTIFGRSGAVAAQSGDYTASQVTNAADKTGPNSYAAGARQTFANLQPDRIYTIVEGQAEIQPFQPKQKIVVSGQ